ncbi:MAG: hypothetical protein C5B47_01610 [Verrucomicrobia bacterium]|nr:MAG: hypothetical protein C5B47_01610 [Verrucomicrobiota bacterium]
MNQFILISLLSILSMAWPLSVVQARCGLGGNVGLGGNIQRFEAPAVNEWVSINGFTLKVNRVKWAIQTMTAKRTISAFFRDDSTAIRAIEFPALPPHQSLRDFALLSAPFPGQNAHVENVRTAFNVWGVKASYGGAPSFPGQNPLVVRYYFQGQSGRITCFEVLPMKRFVDWSESNNLILNTLSRQRSS